VVAESLGVSRRTVARKLARFLEVAREHLAVAIAAAALTGCGGGFGLNESASSAHGGTVEAQPAASASVHAVAPEAGAAGAPAGLQRASADRADATAGDVLARPRAGEDAAVRADDPGAESEAAQGPVLGEFSPTEAPVAGGAALVIRGENLDVAQVTIDGTPARILDSAAHLVVVEVPEGGPGQAIVKVTNRDGRFAFRAGFRYTR
jgi:hypothetical protein